VDIRHASMDRMKKEGAMLFFKKENILCQRWLGVCLLAERLNKKYFVLKVLGKF
jgi:hypothetical protein